MMQHLQNALVSRYMMELHKVCQPDRYMWWISTFKYKRSQFRTNSGSSLSPPWNNIWLLRPDAMWNRWPDGTQRESYFELVNSYFRSTVHGLWQVRTSSRRSHTNSKRKRHEKREQTRRSRAHYFAFVAGGSKSVQRGTTAPAYW